MSTSVLQAPAGGYASNGGRGPYASNGGTGSYASNRDASIGPAASAESGSLRRGSDGVAVEFGPGGFGANEFGPGGFTPDALGRAGARPESLDGVGSGASGFERDGIRQSRLGRPTLGRGQVRPTATDSSFETAAEAAAATGTNDRAAPAISAFQGGGVVGVGTSAPADAPQQDAGSSLFPRHGGMFNR